MKVPCRELIYRACKTLNILILTEKNRVIIHYDLTKRLVIDDCAFKKVIKTMLFIEQLIKE